MALFRRKQGALYASIKHSNIGQNRRKKVKFPIWARFNLG